MIDRGYILAKEKNTHGSSKSLKRLTILFVCSMTGEKLTPLVIGKYNKPRCFNSVKSLPLQYYSNKNAWMTSDIFTTFLIKWNRELTVSNRNILLFVDNFSGHPNISLSNITICYYPANTTSVLQPLDQGIINSFKAIYKNHLMSSLIYQVETENSKGYTLPNVLEAIYLIIKSWEQVKKETIINCFKKAFYEENITNETIETPFINEILNSINEEKKLEVIEKCKNKLINNNMDSQTTQERNENNLGIIDSSESEDDDKKINISNEEAIDLLSKIRKFIKIKIPSMLGQVTEIEMALINHLNKSVKINNINTYFTKKI